MIKSLRPLVGKGHPEDRPGGTYRGSGSDLTQRKGLVSRTGLSDALCCHVNLWPRASGNDTGPVKSAVQQDLFLYFLQSETSRYNSVLPSMLIIIWLEYVLT